MDLLSSLNLHILPEQQTRINDKISSALQANPNIRLGFDACCTCAKPLQNPNGIDDATRDLPVDKEKKEQAIDPTSKSISSCICCKGCQRVWYCSKECRNEDTRLSSSTVSFTNSSLEEEEEQARGHSPIVCSLLRLCNIDEEVELEYENQIRTKESSSHSNEKNNNYTKKKITFSTQEKKASMDRISSEHESYPATLNVLMDAPCFEQVLDKFTMPRRGKKMRQADLQEHGYGHGSNSMNTLTIHIIGSSEEAELWGDFQLDYEYRSSTSNSNNGAGRNRHTRTDAIRAYAEVLSELAGTYKKLRKIVLAFIGPNCPEDDMRVVKYIDGGDHDDDDVNVVEERESGGKKRKRNEGKHNHHHHHHGKNHCQIVIETHCHNYEKKYFDSSSKKKEKHHNDKSVLTKPDIVIFFNPGFTCPDYQWEEALKACQQSTKTTPSSSSSSTSTSSAKENPIPFLVTTNTEMEAIADVQYLHQHGYIDTLPPAVADIVNEDGQYDHRDSDMIWDCHHSNNSNTNNQNGNFFFGENVNAGSRVRQSGNMANDLFCKNKYIFGGYFCHHHTREQHMSTMNLNSENGKTSGEVEGKITSSSSVLENSNKNSQSLYKNKKKGNAALM